MRKSLFAVLLLTACQTQLPPVLSPSASPSPIPPSPSASALPSPNPSVSPSPAPTPTPVPVYAHAFPIEVIERSACGGSQRRWQIDAAHQLTFEDSYPPGVGAQNLPKTVQYKQLSQAQAQGLLTLLDRLQLQQALPSGQEGQCSSLDSTVLALKVNLQDDSTQTYQLSDFRDYNQAQLDILAEGRKALTDLRTARSTARTYEYLPAFNVYIQYIDSKEPYLRYSLDSKGLLTGRHPEGLKQGTAYPDFKTRQLNTQEQEHLLQLLNSENPIRSFDELAAPYGNEIAIMATPVYWVFQTPDQQRVIPEETLNWYGNSSDALVGNHRNKLGAVKVQLDRWLFGRSY